MNKFDLPPLDSLKVFETVPNMYLIVSPALVILTASNLFLEATQTVRKSIVGRYIFDAFPDNPSLPNADGVKNINASLQEVLRSKKPHFMKSNVMMFLIWPIPVVLSLGIGNLAIRQYWI